MSISENNNKNKEEASATVRKKGGKYFDLTDISLASKGIKRLTNKQFLDLFRKVRLRFNLTPQCNLWCVFCSNEGSDYSAKRKKEADIDQVIKLSDIIIKNTPLKFIDFSGGEPTIHSDFMSGNFKLLKWTKKHRHIRFSLHSNGVTLFPEIIDRIKGNFSRIGLSVHSFNFNTWNRITNLKNVYPLDIQKKKFNQMLNNIEYLAKQDIGDKVFIKSVVMKGINNNLRELKELLDFCADHGFHPKFLEFEPQYKEQEKYIVGRKELFAKLDKLGCRFTSDAPRDNNPDKYIPGVNFEYKGKKGAGMGLHSIFGCGDSGACESCYLFLCMFVKPSDNGKGLYLKPCSPLDTRFDLSWALKRGDKQHILDIFKLSREYLMLAPGLGINSWNKEDEYNMELPCK